MNTKIICIYCIVAWQIIAHGDCEDDEERVYDQTSRRHCRFNVSERQMRRRAAQRHQMSYTIDDLE